MKVPIFVCYTVMWYIIFCPVFIYFILFIFIRIVAYATLDVSNYVLQNYNTRTLCSTKIKRPEIF